MEKTVLLLNGPNLNLLGTREPGIYGAITLPEIEKNVTTILKKHQIECLTFQSNTEGVLIDWLHGHRHAHFLIFNPGAFTHTSIALRDAVTGIDVPLIEIHISNVHKRETFRSHSYFSDIAVGSIIGLGVYGYELAALAAIRHLQK